MPVLLVQCGVFNIGAKNEPCGTSASVKRYLHVNLSINSCGLFSCASGAAPEPEVVFDSVLDFSSAQMLP